MASFDFALAVASQPATKKVSNVFSHRVNKVRVKKSLYIGKRGCYAVKILRFEAVPS